MDGADPVEVSAEDGAPRPPVVGDADPRGDVMGVDAGGGGGGRAGGGGCSAAGGAGRLQCAFCHVNYWLHRGGLPHYARHLMQRHVGCRVNREAEAKLAGSVARCECGRVVAVGSGDCNCGAEAVGRRALVEGDVIVARSAPRPPTGARAERERARMAAADALADGGGTISGWLDRLEIGAVEAAAAAVEPWSGGETVVHLPEAVRPVLAEMFATLLAAAVRGENKAGRMLQALPKLLLHRAGLKKLGVGGTVGAIRRRAQMLLDGKIAELRVMIQAEREGGDRVTQGNRPASGKSRGALEAVTVMARAGACSKAVKRIAAEFVRYDGEDAVTWAQRLIPDVPAGMENVGARPVQEAERAALRKIKTCAADIVEAEEDSDAEDEDGGGAGAEDGGGGDRAEGVPEREGKGGGAGGSKKGGKGGGRSPTAFAEGVRFGALSAPGPSGLRPEHLKALGRCRRARSRHEYEKAMRLFVATAVRGELPESCWWITDTAVTLVRKPGALPGAAPRPLRVGETLKRFVAKRIATAERGAMQKVFARRRQFGVACPGGAEILLHHRLVSCRGAAELSVGEWDLDVKNCYGSLYWGCIDEGVERHVKAALPWTRWMHSRAVRVLLPGGRVHMTQRGAEQGDLGRNVCGGGDS